MNQAYKENLITEEWNFPVDVFIQDNLKGNVVVAPHWHECMEILYMLEGSAVQNINHREFVFTRNDIIILKEGDIHATRCAPGEDVRILVIKFLPGVLRHPYSNTFESKYVLPFVNSGKSSVFHIEDACGGSGKLQELLLGLYREFVKKEAAYELYVKGYILQLLSLLVRSGILNIYNPGIKEKQLKVLDTLLRYIESHYAEEIDLKKASRIANISYFHLSRTFKKVTGRNFKDYVDFVRICEAEKLILQEDMKISRAALAVGFKDVSGFNRVYKRLRNYTPKEIKRARTANKSANPPVQNTGDIL